MPAKQIECEILEKNWITDTVVHLRFMPRKKFRFEPGQFCSVVVPAAPGGKAVRRAYSFALPYEIAKEAGYELCIKLVDGGAGSGYMSRLEKGDSFSIFTPYGDFIYRPAREGRQVMFICTGTGIAPFRAIVLSDHFQEHAPDKVISLFGARTEDEVLFADLFESHGIEVVNAISRPGPDFRGFTGRVTDYLRSLPRDWPWHSTDYYLCGNGEMISEVKRILVDGHGVPLANVRQEAYFTQQFMESPAEARKKAA